LGLGSAPTSILFFNKTWYRQFSAGTCQPAHIAGAAAAPGREKPGGQQQRQLKKSNFYKKNRFK
jgi:hypothetical protein